SQVARSPNVVGTPGPRASQRSADAPCARACWWRHLHPAHPPVWRVLQAVVRVEMSSTAAWMAALRLGRIRADHHPHPLMEEQSDLTCPVLRRRSCWLATGVL